MAVDEDKSTTRVFVSGLPPSFTSKQLRTLFAEKFTVTDAHVLTDRRIGFVGLSDHDSAKDASKYFNKSFIRMSKISVDLARPVDAQTIKGAQPSSVPRQPLRDPGTAPDVNATAKIHKRKRDQRDDGEPSRNQGQPNPSTSDSLPTIQDFRQERKSPQGELELEVPPITASDSDWLRGKTNRVLDLQDPTSESRDDGLESPPPSVEEHPDPEDALATVSRDEDPTSNPDTQALVSNGRLFLRNLAFSVSEEDLRGILLPYGKLVEDYISMLAADVDQVHIVKDPRSLTSRGLAFVQFQDPLNAQAALSALDATPFQGRLLHVLPASDKRAQKLSEFEISKLPLKKQKDIRRKANASTSAFSWNSMYMNPDAVLASIADRLGVPKSELLDPTSTDAAVKQARAETSVIQETKDYLKSQGINTESFKSGKRHERGLLLKNFPFGTTQEELTLMLSDYGSLEKVIFPPTGTIAIAVFEESYAAQNALKSLAYKNFKGSVLYIEKAPAEMFQAITPTDNASVNPESQTDTTPGPNATVFVRNLNFATTTARLTELFKPLTGFLSATVKTKTDAKRPGEVLSTGFGFVEFHTKQQAAAAVATMNSHRLDGHQVLVQLSTKTVDAAEERRQEDKSRTDDRGKTKIIVKNLPFEASKRDIKSLLGTYGKLRSVRVPKKADNSTRGFAFAEFVTAKEAANAMEALSSTHLLGRRLVLELAEAEIDDPEETIKAMEKRAGRQSHLTAVNDLITGSARKKFNADAPDDATI